MLILAQAHSENLLVDVYPCPPDSPGLTCGRMNGEEPHVVPTGKVEGQLPLRAGVWVPGLQLKHGCTQRGIFLDRGVEHGSRHAGYVVVDVRNLNVDFSDGREGNGALVHSQYRQPVEGCEFSVQRCQSLEHSWGQRVMKPNILRSQRGLETTLLRAGEGGSMSYLLYEYENLNSDLQCSHKSWVRWWVPITSALGKRGGGGRGVCGLVVCQAS